MVDSALSVLLFCSFVALTLCLTLRWIVSGTVPMSNGYETMLIVAWFVNVGGIDYLSQSEYREDVCLFVVGFLLVGESHRSNGPTNHSCYARAQLAIVGHSR